MKLYHFTSARFLHDIQRSGYLKTTNSDIRPTGAGPAVVWLTSNPKHEQKWTKGAADFFLLFKWGIRITVEVPDKSAHHWPKWSKKMGISPKWYRAMSKAGEENEWYVVTRPIGKDEWKAIEMWDGFHSSGKGEYNEEFLIAFIEHYASDEAPKWMRDAMTCKITDCNHVKPVPVSEWKEAGDQRATRKAEKNFNRDMYELRKEMAPFIEMQSGVMTH